MRKRERKKKTNLKCFNYSYVNIDSVNSSQFENNFIVYIGHPNDPINQLLQNNQINYYCKIKLYKSNIIENIFHITETTIQPLKKERILCTMH